MQIPQYKLPLVLITNISIIHAIILLQKKKKKIPCQLQQPLHEATAHSQPHFL